MQRLVDPVVLVRRSQHRRTNALIRPGIRRFQPCRQRPGLGRRLFDAHSRTQPANGVERAPLPSICERPAIHQSQCRTHRRRDPHIEPQHRRGSAKVRRRHADNRHWLPVHRNRGSHDRRIRLKHLFPKTVTDYRHGMRAQRVRIFFRRVQPPNLRGHSQHREVVPADEFPPDQLRSLRVTAERKRTLPVHCQTRNPRHLPLEIPVIRPRNARAAVRSRRRHHLQHRQLVGPAGSGKRMVEDRLHP